MEETRRQATMEDIPAIAHYLKTTCANVIQRYTLSDLTVAKTDGKVSALWKKVEKKWWERVLASKACPFKKEDDKERLRALSTIQNLGVNVRIESRYWGTDSDYWKSSLTKEFGILPSVYEEELTYASADDKKKCELLGNLYERLICCRHNLHTGKPHQVFEKYKIPSKMRNITHKDENTWWASASQCKCYPTTDGHDYTLFGEYVKI